RLPARGLSFVVLHARCALSGELAGPKAQENKRLRFGLGVSLPTLSRGAILGVDTFGWRLSGPAQGLAAGEGRGRGARGPFPRRSHRARWHYGTVTPRPGKAP